jgi:two-component system, NtrC family, C4-dicarboxylate transport response regulator DctD
MGGWSMRHIVHVDNSKFFRKLMKVFLSELGLECEGFDLGEDALTAVMTGEVSCVITGLELPDMSGEKLINRIIAFAPTSLTIIVVTSSANDEERMKVLEAMGVKATIQKAGDWKEKLREYF